MPSAGLFEDEADDEDEDEDEKSCAMRELAFYIDPRDPELPGRLSFLRDHGIRLVGTDGMGPDPEPIRRVGRLFEQAGIGVVAVHGVGALAVPGEDDSALRATHLGDLDRAAAWGADCVVLHFRSLALPWHDGIWHEEASHITRVGLDAYDSRIAGLLEWLCEEAGRRRLSIALENLPAHFPFSWRVEEIVAMVERVGAPNLGICLDSGHAHGSGIDVAAALRTAGRHLITTHLHDNFGGGPHLPIHRVDRHLAAGLGTICWPAVIRALDASGYSGPAVFEGVSLGKGQNADPAGWEEAVRITIATWRAFVALATEPAD